MDVEIQADTEGSPVSSLICY